MSICLRIDAAEPIAFPHSPLHFTNTSSVGEILAGDFFVSLTKSEVRLILIKSVFGFREAIMDSRQWNRSYSEIKNQYSAVYRSIAVHSGFSETQFRILYHLYLEQKSYTQNELAEQFYLSKQTINSAIAKLNNMGLVRLDKGTAGKNSKLVSLTESGLQRCEECIKPLLEAENKALSQMDDSEVCEFLRLYETLCLKFGCEISRLYEESTK